MAKIKADNRYAFTFTNNAWNTNSGIKKRLFFTCANIYSTFLYAKVMRNTHICLELDV